MIKMKTDMESRQKVLDTLGPAGAAPAETPELSVRMLTASSCSTARSWKPPHTYQQGTGCIPQMAVPRFKVTLQQSRKCVAGGGTGPAFRMYGLG